MKKFLYISIVILLLCGFLASPGAKAVTSDVPIPLNYCAYSSEQTVFIQWNYSCPSGFTCYVEIEEYTSGAWHNITTVSATSSPKTFSGQSYGSHQYRMRAKLIYGLITMYSSYTPNFYAYVLHVPTGLTVSVNPDVFLDQGDLYLRLKWNPVDSNATYVRIWRRMQGIDIYDVRATLTSSTTTFTDTTVLPNTTYEYVIYVIRKDDTSIHDDNSLSSAMVSKLTLPAPPTNFQANGIDKTVYMAWSHTKNCDGYKIYKWGKSGFLFTWSLVATLNKNTFSYNTTVPDYGVYSFKVAAYNASGGSPKSPIKDAYALKTPTNLTATSLSSNSIRLNWDPVDSNATNIVISRSLNGIVYAGLTSISATNTSYTDSSCSPDTKYWYEIKAKRDLNESNVSNVASTKTLPIGSPPSSPSNLQGTVINCTQIDLTWQDNSGDETNFIVERKKEGDCCFSVKATLPSNTTVYSDTTLSANTKYYYRVKAKNSFGDSGYSNEINLTTPPCGSPPNAPSELNGVASSCNKVDLTWTDNSDNEDGFKIERKEIEGSYAEAGTVSANVAAFSDTTVQPNKTYYYRVRAYNGFGNSNYSGEVNTTTPPCGTPPSAPTNLTASVISTTEVSLSWTDVSDNEDGFKIERKESGGTYSEIKTLSAGTTSYSDTGLSPNTTYYYRIRAFNSYGTSSYSNEASATTKAELSVPAKPTNLFASASSPTEIRLSWTDASDNEDGFKVERKTSGSSFTEIKILTANSTTYTDTGLTPDTTYYYRVRAYNAAGYSDYSNEASATTQKAVESIIIRLYIDKTTYYVNDTLMTMDVAPIIRESRTLLPIRYVVEALGADVEWNATERKVTITFKETTIELWIDKNTAKVNGEYKLIDATNPKVTPIIIPPGRTMLPIRFIAENLGCLVEWSDQLREVKVTYPAP